MTRGLIEISLMRVVVLTITICSVKSRCQRGVATIGPTSMPGTVSGQDPRRAQNPYLSDPPDGQNNGSVDSTCLTTVVPGFERRDDYLPAPLY